MILRNFLYLDATALAGYVSGVEGGLRRGTESETSTSRSRGLEADAKVLRGHAGRDASGIDRARADDTPEARFHRLLEFAKANSEDLAWIDVVNPEVDLESVGTGAMISGEADFYIPAMIAALAAQGSGGMTEMLAMVDQFEPMAKSLGLDMDGIPSKTDRDGLRGLIESLKADVVAVGEFADCDWKVAGQLDARHLRATVDGPAKFVGKVAKSWPDGEGRHLLALPGTTLLPRAKRRELEKQRPEDPDDDSFLPGPALMLDLLAVWR